MHVGAVLQKKFCQGKVAQVNGNGQGVDLADSGALERVEEQVQEGTLDESAAAGSRSPST